MPVLLGFPVPKSNSIYEGYSFLPYINGHQGIIAGYMYVCIPVCRILLVLCLFKGFVVVVCLFKGFVVCLFKFLYCNAI
jgi:hypothetical protein